MIARLGGVETGPVDLIRWGGQRVEEMPEEGACVGEVAIKIQTTVPIHLLFLLKSTYLT